MLFLQAWGMRYADTVPEKRIGALLVGGADPAFFLWTQLSHPDDV